MPPQQRMPPQPSAGVRLPPHYSVGMPQAPLAEGARLPHHGADGFRPPPSVAGGPANPSGDHGAASQASMVSGSEDDFNKLLQASNITWVEDEKSPKSLSKGKTSRRARAAGYVASSSSKGSAYAAPVVNAAPAPAPRRRARSPREDSASASGGALPGSAADVGVDRADDRTQRATHAQRRRDRASRRAETNDALAAAEKALRRARP